MDASPRSPSSSDPRPERVHIGGRNKLPDCYRDMSLWPGFDDACLKDKKRKRYIRLRDATALYLSGYPLAKVVRVAQVTERRFLRIFGRCFQLDEEGKILGCRAFVAGEFKSPPIRIAPITPGENSRAGFSGAFGKLLRDNPQIEDRLVTYLNGHGTKGLRPNKTLSRQLQRSFEKICREEGILENQYPFNTLARGGKALREWVNKKYLPLYARRFISKEFGRDAGDLISYGEGDGGADRVQAGYGPWVIDEVSIDLEARYETPNPQGGWDQLNLRRFIQLRVVDDQTGANLAGLQVYTPQASAEDVSRLLWYAVNGPKAVNLTIPGLQLEPGAGYPANVIPALKFAIPTVVYLDNALAHLADHVQHIGLVLFGAKVLMGKPKTPHERAIVESKFSLQANRVVHQLPSTTGAGPWDPVRKASSVPTEKRVLGDDLEQVLDVYMQGENALPLARSHNISPLERLQRLLQAKYIQPMYLAVDKRKAYYFSKPFRVTVKTDLEHGRRPYINYLYERYTSSALSKRFDLKEQKMYVRADFENIRTVMLFFENGNEFGPIQVIGRWGEFPHDVRIRKMHYGFKRKGQLGPRADDRPLEALFGHLRAKAPRDTTAASQLAYVVAYLTRHDFVMNEVLTENLQTWVELVKASKATSTLAVFPIDAENAALLSPWTEMPSPGEVLMTTPNISDVLSNSRPQSTNPPSLKKKSWAIKSRAIRE